MPKVLPPANPNAVGPNPEYPDWLNQILLDASVSPAVGFKVPDRLTKLLGEILKPVTRRAGIPGGVPRRMRLSSIDPEKGEAALHEVGSWSPYSTKQKDFVSPTSYTSSIDDLDKLIGSNQLVKEGAQTQGMASVESLVKRLNDILNESTIQGRKATAKTRRVPKGPDVSDRRYTELMGKLGGTKGKK